MATPSAVRGTMSGVPRGRDIPALVSLTAHPVGPVSQRRPVAQPGWPRTLGGARRCAGPSRPVLSAAPLLPPSWGRPGVRIDPGWQPGRTMLTLLWASRAGVGDSEALADRLRAACAPGEPVQDRHHRRDSAADHPRQLRPRPASPRKNVCKIPMSTSVTIRSC